MATGDGTNDARAPGATAAAAAYGRGLSRLPARPKLPLAGNFDCRHPHAASAYGAAATPTSQHAVVRRGVDKIYGKGERRE